MPFSPTVTDDEEHPPALSGTPTAWITLGLIVALAAGWLFSDQLLCGAVRTVFFASSQLCGERVHVEKIFMAPDGGFDLRGIEWTRGRQEHGSSLRCDWAIIRTVSAWRMIFPAAGQGRGWIRELIVGKAKLLVDVRDTPQATTASSGRPSANGLFLNPRFLPAALSAGPVDVVVIGSAGRIAVNGLTLRLPSRWPGRVALSDATIDVGSWHRMVPKGTAPAQWDGGPLRIGELGLGDGMTLKELTLRPLEDRLEFGLRGVIGKGILRGDGSIGRQGQSSRLEVTLVGEGLGLDAFAGFLKDGNQATGTISQARLTFRGDPTRPLDADSALRLVAKNFRWEGKGWESLRVAATLTGRTLTLSELLLRQGENELEAEGQSRLPADWHALMHAPFRANFSAMLSDAGSLASLAGPSLGRLGGGLSFEGELHGADNKAEGYCNFAGSGTRLRDLAVDWLKGSILFKGEKTELAYFEAHAGEDRVEASGTLANSMPHDYSAQATVASGNFPKRLAQLGVATVSASGSGGLKGTWQGWGSTAGHTGSFQASTTDWVSRWTTTGMSGSFEGSYGPGRFTLSKAEFLQDDLTLSMRLEATASKLAVSSIRALRAGKTQPLLEGSVSLPVDANDGWESGDLLRTLSMDKPVAADLRLRGITAGELAGVLGQKSGIRGTLDGELSVAGTPGEPLLNGTLHLGKFTPPDGGEPRDLQLSIETHDHRASVSLKQEGAEPPPLALRIAGPLRLTNDQGRLRFAGESEPLEGAVALRQIPLDGWASLLGLGGDRWPLLHATGTGDVKVSGTAGQPALGGTMVLRAKQAGLFGRNRLEDVDLPLVMAGGKPVMIMTNGSARYAGKPVALSGKIDLGGDTRESDVRMEGCSLPVSLGLGIITTADADLRFTAKGTNPPVLGGAVVLQPAAIDLCRRLTPCFAPPGIALAAATPSPQPTAALGNLQLALTLKTSGSKGEAAEPSAPQIWADLSVQGEARSPKVTGSVTAINQTLRLPSGSFLLPEAKIVLDEAGTKMESAHAFGITRLGFCTLSPSGDLEKTDCGIAGREGTMAADLLLALASSPSGRGDNAAPILQIAAWLRQETLFPTPAAEWSTRQPGSPAPGALGYYGTPWVWNWSGESRSIEPTTNTAR